MEETMTVAQTPVRSGFTAASTALDVVKGIDLSGAVAIVTGAASPMGIETVRALTGIGVQVVAPARNVVAAGASLGYIDGVQIEYVDLMEPDSVDEFADRFLSTRQPLRILINGAAVMGLPLMRDSRGYEAHFSTNYLGHFHLTARLWPALVAANGARVINIASAVHQLSSIDFDDLHFRAKPYRPFAAYAQAELSNVLFSVALDARGVEGGVRAYSVNPGIAMTSLTSQIRDADLQSLGVLDADSRPAIDPARNLKTSAQAAATAVWCATSPRLSGVGGVYCENSDIARLALPTFSKESGELAGLTLAPGVAEGALEADLAERLWETSQKLLGNGGLLASPVEASATATHADNRKDCGCHHTVSGIQ
jgi:NAD(P)-dependent dehydrogenase (short-subunit alcohol dehydrogenase family)